MSENVDGPLLSINLFECLSEAKAGLFNCKMLMSDTRIIKYERRVYSQCDF